MKITLDLDRLLHEGRIDHPEVERLKALASEQTTAMGFSILVGFGVVFVAGAALALVPNAWTAVFLGAIGLVGGIALLLSGGRALGLLANIVILVGVLMFGGGIVAAYEGALPAMALLVAVFLAGAVAARSHLLMVAAMLASASMLGAATGYTHARYALVIVEPALTAVFYAAIGLAAYQLSLRVAPPWSGLSLTASRTAVFLVNFGLWVGSLWGDRLTLLRSLGGQAPANRYETVLSPALFSIVWAVAIVGAGLWAVRANRRWLVNVAAVFGAIHFYTQWFERFGPNPLSILLAGLVMLAAALGLWSLNQRLRGEPPAAVTPR